jgi:Ca2+-binding EF-hand superfamily protein
MIYTANSFIFFHNAESVKINFDTFAAIASSFLEEEDDEAMQNELREAFRMYDKEGMLNAFYRG